MSRLQYIFNLHKKKVSQLSSFMGMQGDCIEPGVTLLKSMEGVKSDAGYQRLFRLQCLESLHRQGGLERLNEMQRLEGTALVNGNTRLTVTQGSYDDIGIKEDSIIYCDIPYKGTAGYNGDKTTSSFDYEKFYAWCEKQTVPVFISEYSMPQDRFDCLATIEKRSLLSPSTKCLKKNECLFIPKKQREIVEKMQRETQTLVLNGKLPKVYDKEIENATFTDDEDEIFDNENEGGKNAVLFMKYKNGGQLELF